MAEGELAAHPAPLPGDLNPQVTAPDGEEQTWAEPWRDLLVNGRRGFHVVLDALSPIPVGVNTRDVWAALVPYSVPVSADFLHACWCDAYLYFTCSHTELQSSVYWDLAGSPRCTGVTQGRAVVAGRDVL